MTPRECTRAVAGLVLASALAGCGPAQVVVVVEPPRAPVAPVATVAPVLSPVVVVQPAGAPTVPLAPPAAPLASTVAVPVEVEVEVEASGCDRAMWWSDGATGRTWAEARALCLERGGDLASIHSPAERACANAVLREAGAPPVGAWIGLHEVEREGAWRWSDGRAASFVPWLAGEPNDDAEGPHDCAHIWRERSDDWNDIPCSRRDVSLLCRMRP